MSSVFVISAPAETTKEEVVNSLRSKIAGQAEIRPFRLPDFKVIIIFYHTLEIKHKRLKYSY